jgi:hypothetical protein
MIMNNNFKLGFKEGLNKLAGLNKEDLSAGAIGMIPLGTTLHSKVFKKENKRYPDEWKKRVGGGLAGSVLGTLPGIALGLAGVRSGKSGLLRAGKILGNIGGTGGAILGEAYGHKSARESVKK